MSTSFSVVRLIADGKGESRFDDYEVSQPFIQFAPPAPPLFVSPVEGAIGYVVLRIPVGWIGEPHPSPHRQMLFFMSGVLRATASDGTVRIIKPGTAWLMADTDGKGHKSEVISDVPFDAIVVLLANPS